MSVAVESEIRVLEIDRDDVVSRIQRLGGKHHFSGRLTTFYLERLDTPTYADSHQSFRVRLTDGWDYITAGTTNLTKRAFYTELTIKTKKDSKDKKGTDSRERFENNTARYECDELSNVLRDQLLARHYVKASEEKLRDSYQRDRIKFELDHVQKTLTLGDRVLPLFLEIETPYSELTCATVEELGFSLDDPRVVSWSMSDILRFYSKKWGVPLTTPPNVIR